MVASLEAEFEPVPELGRRVLIATPLVVLRCVAFDSRHEEKDCVDIARLALADANDHAIHNALPEAVNRLPRGVRASIRGAREAFANPDGAAAGYLLTTWRSTPLWDEDDWEAEDLLRQDVAAAVRDLLQP